MSRDNSVLTRVRRRLSGRAPRPCRVASGARMRLRSHTKRTLAAKRTLALPSFALLALALGACGSTVSTSGFKGEPHEAVQAVSNLQSDATAADEKKVCADDLAT